MKIGLMTLWDRALLIYFVIFQVLRAQSWTGAVFLSRIVWWIDLFYCGTDYDINE